MDELQRIKEEQPETYRTIELDLSVARENELIKFEGNSINPLNIEGSVEIRLNNASNSPILLERITYLQSPFYEIYISNPAQPDKKATFVLGSLCQFGFHGVDTANEWKLNAFMEKFTPVAFLRSGTAPLTVELDTLDGRPNLEIHLMTKAAATFTMWGTLKPPFWVQFDTHSFTGTGFKHFKYTNAFRYIKVETTNTGVSVDILIVAGR